MPNNFFLTGYPGAGKSTLIRKLVENLGVIPGGFFSQLQMTPAGEEQLLLFPAEELLVSRGDAAEGRKLREDASDGGKSREGEKESGSLEESRKSNYIRKRGEEEVLVATRRHRGAPWKVDNGAFNRQGVELLERGLKSREFIVMDELGRFELGAFNFQQKILEALESDKPVMGVIKYERNQFLKKVWDSPGVEVFWVERSKGDSLFRLLVERLNRLVSRD